MNLGHENRLPKMGHLGRPMTFSVIIPTFNRDDLLAQCLDCLIEGKQSGMSMDRNSSKNKAIYEVIVTDDSQTPTTKKFLQENYPEVLHVYGPGKGPASNRNRGASFATGKWLIFTDDDCIPFKDWLNSFYKSIMDNKNIRAFEGSIHPRGNLDEDLAECPENINGGNFWSANICVEKKLFDEIDGFDEKYKIAANEDQDIKIRVEKETEIIFIPDAKVVHPVRRREILPSIARIPSIVESWAYHVTKHGNNLNIKNINGALSETLYFNVRAIIYHLKDRHFKSVLINLILILWGIPRFYFLLKRNHF